MIQLVVWLASGTLLVSCGSAPGGGAGDGPPNNPIEDPSTPGEGEDDEGWFVYSLSGAVSGSFSGEADVPTLEPNWAVAYLPGYTPETGTCTVILVVYHNGQPGTYHGSSSQQTANGAAVRCPTLFETNEIDDVETTITVEHVDNISLEASFTIRQTILNGSQEIRAEGRFRAPPLGIDSAPQVKVTP